MREGVEPASDAAAPKNNGEKSRRTGRLLAVFKAVVLLGLAGVVA